MVEEKKCFVWKDSQYLLKLSTYFFVHTTSVIPDFDQKPFFAYPSVSQNFICEKKAVNSLRKKKQDFFVFSKKKQEVKYTLHKRVLCKLCLLYVTCTTLPSPPHGFEVSPPTKSFPPTPPPHEKKTLPIIPPDDILRRNIFFWPFTCTLAMNQVHNTISLS